MPAEANRVLVLGIYLLDVENTADHVRRELSQSREWTIDQRWVALGERPVPAELADVTTEVVRSRTPKFVVLNRLLRQVPWPDYDWVMVVDDDIRLPPGFVDAFLRRAERHDFALAQPARTHGSHIDHHFVEQLDGLAARCTRFVEIGPVFSMRADAAALLLPFDEASPMGWGYDFVWPRKLGDAGLKLGIVDETPVDHSLRKPVAAYSWENADREMQAYLGLNPHLTKDEAFVIVEAYT